MPPATATGPALAAPHARPTLIKKRLLSKRLYNRQKPLCCLSKTLILSPPLLTKTKTVPYYWLHILIYKNTNNSAAFV